jgi:hypothetical protein
MPNLGHIKKIDLREVWPNEAEDFTPWLAEHIAQLGDALGLELELRSTEAPVGQYSLDVWAYETGSNRSVVIENQLETTNHNHLGQLLTYAAGYDASVVVWLTAEFRDEHRAALDWLNTRTGENTQFFGVVVEAWQIDDSRPAPYFSLVVVPNQWRRQTATADRATGSGNVSERRERYRVYFQSLIDSLREDHRFTNVRQGQPQNWYGFSSGTRGISYSTAFPIGGRCRVEVYIDLGDQALNENLFDQLSENKDRIESELGSALEWDRLDGRRACRISAVRPGSIDDEPEELENTRIWMIGNLLQFKGVFGPYLTEFAG